MHSGTGGGGVGGGGQKNPVSLCFAALSLAVVFAPLQISECLKQPNHFYNINSDEILGHLINLISLPHM